MELFDIYKDIQMRTKGEIYIGVVGPVRTGKSTFIKRFMDLLVLPNLEDIHRKEQTRDELPQSASGTTIMTTEPKFVPKEAAEIRLMEELDVMVRLIDCVGYMVDGATGHLENNQERQVKTPWFEKEIPFTKAADIGTKKVIHDHSTVGIVVTTDGSIGELSREAYKTAEEKTIRELQEIGKPFIVLVNTKRPYSEEAKQVAADLRDMYQVTAIPVNCEQLREEDIHHMMEELLCAFPIGEVEFYLPKWVEMLPMEHPVKKEVLLQVEKVMEQLKTIKDASKKLEVKDCDYLRTIRVDGVAMDTGCVKISMGFAQETYYAVLSELTKTEIQGEYDLIWTIRNLAGLKAEYENVKEAMENVKMRGYGVVEPRKEEIVLEEPVLMKQGNKFGVKIRSEAPSIHMIRANIETEIAPIVGNEEQAQSLITYIKEASSREEGIWGTNIFGKTIEELVTEGMHQKVASINDESQMKLQDSMQKIVNDSNGGMVCIII